MDLGSEATYGCAHYMRRCKIRSPCCGEVFDCRHCHNEAKNSLQVDLQDRHEIPRHEIKKVGAPCSFVNYLLVFRICFFFCSVLLHFHATRLLFSLQSDVHRLIKKTTVKIKHGIKCENWQVSVSHLRNLKNSCYLRQVSVSYLKFKYQWKYGTTAMQWLWKPILTFFFAPLLQIRLP